MQFTHCVLHLRAYLASFPTNPPEFSHRFRSRNGWEGCSEIMHDIIMQNGLFHFMHAVPNNHPPVWNHWLHKYWSQGTVEKHYVCIVFVMFAGAWSCASHHNFYWIWTKICKFAKNSCSVFFLFVCLFFGIEDIFQEQFSSFQSTDYKTWCWKWAGFTHVYII